MKRIGWAGFACALAWALLGADGAAQARVVAFTHVNVVPMQSDAVLRDQTVIVQDGFIMGIADSAQLHAPGGATIIEGDGKWLAPGLADMHTHIDDPADFAMLLASGVTTTLNMGGSSRAYRTAIRNALRHGDRVGPYPFIGMMIDGPGDPGGSAVVPRTEAEARALVRGARHNGYDYIKVYSRLQPEMFHAIMDEARRVAIPVVGHVVRSVGLEQNLANGLVMIAHSEEYLTVFHDGPPDDTRIPELVSLSTRFHVTVTANIFGLARIAEQWGRPDEVAEYLAAPSALRMRPELRTAWARAGYQRSSGSYSAEARFCERLVVALHQAHVPILIGTDAPSVPGVAPGASVYAEITALRDLGFSNYDALVAATRAPGVFVAQTQPHAERFGEIATGYRADLILLDGNPIDDLSVLQNPVGVMVRGAWIPRAILQHDADAPRAAYRAAEEEFSQFEGDVRTQGAEAAIAAHASRLSAPFPARAPENVLMGIAFRQYRAANLANAAALFRFVQTLYPRSWRAEEGLAETYTALNASAEAAVHWRRAYQFNPNDTDALDALRQLHQ